MPSTHRDEGWKGSLWAFTFKGKKINIYLQKIDLRMLEFPNPPSYSEAQPPGQESHKEDASRAMAACGFQRPVAQRKIKEWHWQKELKVKKKALNSHRKGGESKK